MKPYKACIGFVAPPEEEEEDEEEEEEDRPKAKLPGIPGDKFSR